MGLTPEEVKLVEQHRARQRRKAEQEQEVAEELERELQFQVRSASEYTDEEKIEAFDRMYKFIHGIYMNRRKNERNKDKEYYSFETLMGLLIPKEGGKGKDKSQRRRAFWDHYNNLGQLLGNEEIT